MGHEVSGDNLECERFDKLDGRQEYEIGLCIHEGGSTPKHHVINYSQRSRHHFRFQATGRPQ